MLTHQNLNITLKVEKFACTNFREKKISRGLIFATEDFNYFAVTYFREFREWLIKLIFEVRPSHIRPGGGTLVFDHPTIP